MSNKNEMTSLYSELAPQFLFYLGQEIAKIDAQVERLKGAAVQESDSPVSEPGLEIDSPVGEEVVVDLESDIEADEDLIEADLPALNSA